MRSRRVSLRLVDASLVPESFVLDRKLRGALRKQLGLDLAYAFDPGEPGAALQVREQSPKLCFGAHRVDFDAAVAQIARVAADALPLGGVTGEKAIADALHPSGNEKSPSLLVFGHADDRRGVCPAVGGFYQRSAPDAAERRKAGARAKPAPAQVEWIRPAGADQPDQPQAHLRFRERNAMSAFRTCLKLTSALALAGWAAIPAAAQAPAGPTNLPAPPDVVRLPSRPAPEKAPMPPEEIVRRFGRYEDALSLAFGGFTYRKTVRLEEFGPDGKPSGRSEVATQMTVEADGSRRSRPAGQRVDSTLRFTQLEPDVLEILGQVPVFPFATPQLSKYDITYQAAQPVDDLMTYVFKVTPRQVSRTTAYFSGVIWVDDRDFAVVKTYGKWVTETGDVQFGELPFTFFETYRQYVAGKYWMPAYMRSDDFLGSGEGRVPVRLTIRWEEYKPIPAGSTPATADPADLPAPAPAAQAPAQAPDDPDRPTLAPRQDR